MIDIKKYTSVEPKKRAESIFFYMHQAGIEHAQFDSRYEIGMHRPEIFKECVLYALELTKSFYWIYRSGMQEFLKETFDDEKLNSELSEYLENVDDEFRKELDKWTEWETTGRELDRLKEA